MFVCVTERERGREGEGVRGDRIRESGERWRYFSCVRERCITRRCEEKCISHWYGIYKSEAPICLYYFLF